MSDPKPYVPLSWDVVVAINEGRLHCEYPEDFNGPGNPPSDPTTAPPGSDAKIAVMAARYKRRQRLFHPVDVRDINLPL